jgi:hypothetical protein
VSSDDAPEVGYDPGGEASQPAPVTPSDDVERSPRRLVHELTNAGSVRGLVRTMERYGWAPPFLGLLAHGAVRGVFEHLSEPFAMSQGYVFAGWQLALAINLLYGTALVVLSWFLYFGVIGSFAGFLSETTDMETAVFKVGGYLTVLFVPLLLVGAALVVTIPAPDPVVAGVDPTSEVVETHRAVANSLQMRVVNTLLSAGWILVGFLMLPVVSELYDVGRRESVVAVLPVTLVAVVAAQLF